MKRRQSLGVTSGPADRQCFALMTSPFRSWNERSSGIRAGFCWEIVAEAVDVVLMVAVAVT